MTSTYTANKVYQLQGTGDNPNTWGSLLNTNVFTIIDKNLGGRLSISVAGSSNVTLTQSQADNAYHTMTGLLTGNIDYIFPNQGGFFILKNSSTGSFTVTAKPTGGSGIAIQQGSVTPVFINPDTTALTALFDTLPSLNVSGSTAPAVGMYLQAANVLGLTSRGVIAVVVQNPASPVNYITLSGQATGNAPFIQANGSDTNIALLLATKGTGAFGMYTNSNVLQMQVSHTASAVNYVNITGAATTASPVISATGTDTHVGLLFNAKGTAGFGFRANAGTETLLALTANGSGVNYLSINSAQTGANPIVLAQGSDTNVATGISSKGTGSVIFYTNATSQTQFVVAHTASAVNYLQLTGAATGGNPTHQATGSDTNIGFNYITKGSGDHVFCTNASNTTIQFKATHTASAVNFVKATGAATGNNPILGVGGSDTNVSLILAPQGSGGVGIGNTAPKCLFHAGNADDTPSSPNLIGTFSAAGAVSLAVRDNTNNIESFIHAGSSQGIVGTITAHAFVIRANNTDCIQAGTTGEIYFPNLGTTASAANAFLNSGSSPANQLLRSTSSKRYKRDIIMLDSKDADRIMKLRPVTYRSKAAADDPDRIFYGLIAEEVAEVAPSLVNYIEDQDGNLIPDGVQYDRLPILMLDALKRIESRVSRIDGGIV